MSYELTRTTNHLAIAEQEFCTSHTIQFTSIDSCIGIIACDGHAITAAHLVLRSKSGVAFGPDDLVDVMQVFNQLPYKEIWFVGELGNWNIVTNRFASQANPVAALEFGFKEVKGLVFARVSNKGNIVVRQAINTQGIRTEETRAHEAITQESRPRSKTI